MKTILLSALCLSAFAIGNALEIGAPPNNTELLSDYFTVEVIHNDTVGGGNRVLIELTHSDSTTSVVLYNGSYAPELHAGTTDPYENFTLQVPFNFPEGRAQLSASPMSIPPGIFLGVAASIDVIIPCEICL